MRAEQLIMWLSYYIDAICFIKELSYRCRCFPTILPVPQKTKQAWTGHWRVFCCCRSLEHRWTCYQALLVYRSTISQLYCRRPVLQSSLMAVFSLLRWPTVEVKKAKGANFPNAECPWRNVLEHLAHVSCFQSCSMGLISMIAPSWSGQLYLR